MDVFKVFLGIKIRLENSDLVKGREVWKERMMLL